MLRFPLAKIAIAITWIAAGLAILSNHLSEPGLAKLLEGIVLILNIIPVAAGMLVCLPIVLGFHLGFRSLASVWLVLTLMLSIPYWLWIERRWLTWIQAKVDREIEQRMAAPGGSVGPENPSTSICAIPLAKLCIGFTWLAALGVFLDGSRQAKLIEGILLLLSTLPAMAAMLTRYLLAQLWPGLGTRGPMLAWLILMLGLSIPYWFWLENRLCDSFEKRVAKGVKLRKFMINTEGSNDDARGLRANCEEEEDSD